MQSFLAVGGGLFLLIIGGELLVRGAVKTAEHLGVSPLLIGLTLVGFGTSAPEMAISIQAAASGSPGIAIGNFVGSSTSNILLILGLSAMISPVDVASRAISRDGSMVLMTAMAFALVSFALPYDRTVGAAFMIWLISYLIYAWRQERVAEIEGHTAAYQKAEAYKELFELNFRQRVYHRVRHRAVQVMPVMIAVLGLVVIVLGGKLLVDGATQIARDYHVSEAVIGLTIVAIGTSMPEFVTSMVAAFRGHGAVAIGNILGSNIYNILAVGGATALVQPTIVPDRIIWIDNMVMVAASIALVLFAKSGSRISRPEGALLLTGYIVYIASMWPR
ncbi:MAG TPA: calcium/sodium antiporter [Hyphomicrobiaceae bacterium]|nr:calcium/sodium antiporter [Hyphomicrobiaceae bacterium]